MLGNCSTCCTARTRRRTLVEHQVLLRDLFVQMEIARITGMLMMRSDQRAKDN